MLKISKIDAHGHFGKSYLGPKSPVEPYLEKARDLGVIATIASPGPTPEIIKRTKVFRPCIWKVVDDETRYVSQEKNMVSKETSEKSCSNNPYHKTNLRLFNTAKDYNKKGVKPRILVMPIHHPVLDTKEEVRNMISRTDSVALKLHGISTFTGPKHVSTTTINELLKHDKPLVVHTDLYRDTIRNNTQKAYKLNDPMRWVKWAKKTGVKTFITHGARLSPNAIDIIKSTSNLMVGMSPDLLLTQELKRLHHPTDDFMGELLSMLPPEKLMFDIDYGWNVIKRGEWEAKDWKMCRRLESAAEKVGYSTRDLKKIYNTNAAKFYNI